MTGRELIIYILENHLEDEEIFKDGKIPGYLTINEAALKYRVGPETIKLWYALNFIPGIEMGEELYIPVNVNMKRG